MGSGLGVGDWENRKIEWRGENEDLRREECLY
jgi:hypothetical protein